MLSLLLLLFAMQHSFSLTLLVYLSHLTLILSKLVWCNQGVLRAYCLLQNSLKKPIFALGKDYFVSSKHYVYTIL